jgi:hypothetical protein
VNQGVEMRGTGGERGNQQGENEIISFPFFRAADFLGDLGFCKFFTI